MRINELFTDPLEWKWTIEHESVYKANFVVGKLNYVVTFGKGIRRAGLDDKDRFIVDFHSSRFQGDTNFSITGTGSSVQVFATVVDIIKDFRNKHPGTVLMFSAAEPSRQKLYLRMIQKLGAQYRLRTDPGDGAVTYWVD